jgi:hypothetical protein
VIGFWGKCVYSILLLCDDYLQYITASVVSAMLCRMLNDEFSIVYGYGLLALKFMTCCFSDVYK